MKSVIYVRYVQQCIKIILKMATYSKWNLQYVYFINI